VALSTAQESQTLIQTSVRNVEHAQHQTSALVFLVMVAQHANQDPALECCQPTHRLFVVDTGHALFQINAAARLDTWIRIVRGTLALGRILPLRASAVVTESALLLACALVRQTTLAAVVKLSSAMSTVDLTELVLISIPVLVRAGTLVRCATVGHVRQTALAMGHAQLQRFVDVQMGTLE